MATGRFGRKRIGKQGIGKQRESWFFDDLRSLKRSGLIKDFRRSGWHSKLDYQGVDATVVRVDESEIKVNVTSINQKTIDRHIQTNTELRRNGILIWGHDQSLSPDLRIQLLSKVINDFDPNAKY